MYTGIIQTQGEITAVRPARAGGKLFQVRVNEPDYFSDVKIGDSVNLDGVCFTAIERTADSITVEAMPETLRLTTFGFLKKGSVCNIEKSLLYNGTIGGHLLLGHVDGLAQVSEVRADGDYLRLYFQIPADFHKFLAYKGTIAVNGVSLTVVETTPDGFAVGLISHTREVTNLGGLKAGDTVNFEVDMMARYVDKILQTYSLIK
ncbi:MAG: riboflavin synthase subunit alpha [Candidatus Kerfeldbacteria bacterium RIFCSPHIGHO2_12_FULL_48_17]|uniref:Riboflavin synthase n=1 Tax=Candidatus Kerfeldbacteria bacterium RIFCSPHIGHO2_12_FULL_48_17 TaxID=1798542 RepID=A0A1G2AYD1_9BACT|nr:MAG: riboflavin synthase subunit alpha [Candidatus Kerfeldbacteria bacterium RIFCSPHIGHO2_12_FULL_48_17]